MEALTVALGIVLLFLAAVVGVITLAVVKTRQAVQQAAPQARRAVEDVAIKARSLTRGGAHGRVAALRTEIRGALTSSRRVLEAGSGADAQLSEALTLLARLEQHAAQLDAELRLLEREPDPKRVEGRYQAVRDRADRIIHSASSLRWAAQDRMHRFADEDLARLGDECEAEAGALRHWAPASDRADGAPQDTPGGGAARGGERAAERHRAVGGPDDAADAGWADGVWLRLRKPRPEGSVG
ncbi:hypothetical protein GXW83_07255 [Streptacidiphilus sp. PB12-B1b]|uniref:hypothetical protein n=1 Tax=Streptacidiphilus sp. PB12-B1b TaxID=2705012 RepID=UPI0015F83693|nr:hypothetical protein [Streptacidiphilus sp. PB12-B1b]QMU75562.1 hypothetical protein GXW83_07255 [Streptacidiphilus sp. PB12-B1b]